VTAANEKYTKRNGSYQGQGWLFDVSYIGKIWPINKSHSVETCKKLLTSGDRES